MQLPYSSLRISLVELHFRNVKRGNVRGVFGVFFFLANCVIHETLMSFKKDHSGRKNEQL